MQEIIYLRSEQKRELRQLYAALIHGSYYKEYQKEIATKFPELADVPTFELPELIYSKNQLQFIADAEEANMVIDYGYSGRGMFGDYCPAVRCNSHNDFHTKAKTQIDSMGLGIVIYAQY